MKQESEKKPISVRVPTDLADRFRLCNATHSYANSDVMTALLEFWLSGKDRRDQIMAEHRLRRGLPNPAVFQEHDGLTEAGPEPIKPQLPPKPKRAARSGKRRTG